MQSTTAAEVQALGKFRAFLRSVRAWLRGVLGTVAGIEKARRKGKLKEGDDFGALVDTMLGLEGSKFSKAVESEAEAMLGETHSLTPARRGGALTHEQKQQLRSHISIAQEAFAHARRSGESPDGFGGALLAYDPAAVGETALVATGLKPLFHEGWIFTPEQASAFVAKVQELFPNLKAETWGAHVAVWDEVALQRVLAADAAHYGADSFAAIQSAVESDAIGELLGNGARTRMDGGVTVNYLIDGEIIAGGFITTPELAESLGEQRRQAFELAFGKPVEMQISHYQRQSFSLSPVRRMELVENRLAVVLNQDSEQARKFAERGNERLGRLKSRYAGVPAPKTKAELDKQQAGMVEARRVELEDILAGEVEARLGGVNNLATSLRAHPLGSYLLRSDMRRKRLYLGGIMPESRWRAEQLVNLGLPEDGKAQGGSYDGAGDLPGYFFRGNQRPDDVAKEAFGLGLLDGDSAEDLYNGIGAMLNELATNKADMQRYREQLREARQSAKEEAEYEGRAWRAEEDEKQAFLANPRDAADAVKGVGDLSIVPQLSVTPRLGDGRGNIFIMDIKAQIQYFFAPPLHMWWVDCSLLGSSGSGSTPLPEHADRPRQKQPAKDRQPAHHAFFDPTCCASAPLAQVGPQP